MTKKYCDYKECMMQNHEHYHKDEHTITFKGNSAIKKITLPSDIEVGMKITIKNESDESVIISQNPVQILKNTE